MRHSQGSLGTLLPSVAWLPQLSPAQWLLAALVAAIAALLPGLWTLPGLIGILIAVVVLLRPEAAIYLLTLSVPLGSLAEVEADSFSISPTEGLIGLMVIGWALRSLARRQWPLPVTPLTVPLAAMLAAVVLSAYQATVFGLALKETLKWLELVIVYLFVITEMATFRQAIAIVVMLLAGAIIEGLIGAVQFVFAIGPEFFSIGRFMRAYGTFEQPNPYAGYLGMLIPLAVGLLLARPAPRLRNYLLVAGLVAAMGVGMSLSRGAWMGIALALALMALFWSQRSRLVLAILALGSVPVVALAFLNLLPYEVTSRLATALDYFRFIDVRQEVLTPENFAVLERVAHWQAALDMIASNPIFGVGAGNYPAVYEDFAVGGWVEALGHAHNFYLNVAAEMGIPALLVYVSFLLVAILHTLKWLVKSSRIPAQLPWRGILVGVLGALIASSVHNLFDSLFVHSMSVQLGMILALGQLSSAALSQAIPTDLSSRSQPAS